MPKATVSSLPISGLFGIIKPSGPTSMSLLNNLQPLFSGSKLFAPQNKPDDAGNKAKRRRMKRGGDVKLGQGGTLDPLADGVLVLGVGKGTKKLTQFWTAQKLLYLLRDIGRVADAYCRNTKLPAYLAAKRIPTIARGPSFVPLLGNMLPKKL
ncbi:pseudouridine synthase pus4 [Marasmius tenuissimus]|nr:pseudouridine synthase pus4 [Marasmius tenuissimus]